MGYEDQHEAHVLALRELVNPPFFVSWGLEALFELLVLVVDLGSFSLGEGRNDLIQQFERTGMRWDAAAKVFSFDCAGQ